MEVLSGFQFGRPAAEEGEGSPRSAYELGFYAGITEFWMPKLALGIERDDDEISISAVALENVFRLLPERAGPFDFAWFTAIEAGVESGATNAIEFGPIASWSSGRFAIVFNPFFEKTFGESREQGIAFAYASRVTYRLASQVHVGLEAYGEVENIGNAPNVHDQVHRIGPVLYLGALHGATSHSSGHGEHGVVGDGRRSHHSESEHGEWHAEAGVLFGLTDGTADAALKINLGVGF